jgi:eukaryotic-like serine/threonine-protein kinase
MKATDQHRTSALAVEDLEQIDRICSEFEDQWRKGLTPAIEGFLPGTSGTLRTELMVELLKLEIDYLDRAGCGIARQTYLTRFPLNHQEVDRALAAADCSGDGRIEWAGQRLEFLMRYELLRFHARGGLGEIYLARDASLDRDVAVKFPRNRSPGSMEQLRMAQEARITGRLKHPGIVPVYAVNHGAGDSICYVMQFIHGETLKKAIEQFHDRHQGASDKFRAWEFRQLLQRLVAVCSTVAYAHEEGVIHRDIKPGNVMIGNFGETFLLDWGLAKFVDVELGTSETASASAASDQSTPETTLVDQPAASAIETPPDRRGNTWPAKDGSADGQTAPGQPIGTPEFASPEQVLGDIQAPSDVYSLGATLYFLLTAQQAVDADDLVKLRTAGAFHRIQAPRIRDRRVPLDLNAICMKALSFKRGDRYQTASELGDDIERYLADEPVSVLKPALLSRLGRWVRRRPKRASAIVAGLAVALLAFVCGSWLLNEKADQLAALVQAQAGTNRELNTAKQATELRTMDAIRALHTMADRVVQQWFTRQSSFSDSEKSFLNDLLAQFENLADALPDDSRSRVVRAEGLYNAAQIHQLLGNNGQALALNDAVIEVLTPIPDIIPENTARLLGIAYANRGVLLFERGEYERGIAEIKRGVEFLGELVDTFPGNLNYLKQFRKARNQLGCAWLAQGDARQAAPVFHSLVESIRETILANPEDLYGTDGYLMYLGNLGIARARLGEIGAAEDAYAEARDVYTQLEKRGLLYADAHRATANVTNLIAMGRLAYSQNHLEKADDIHKQAVADCARLIAAFPTLVKAHHNMTGCRYGAALILRDREEYDQALEESRLAVVSASVCLEVAPRSAPYHETRVRSQTLHAQIHELAGNLEEAEKEFMLAVQFAREQHDLTPGPELRIRVAKLLGELAAVQNRRKDKAAAIANLQELIALLESDESARSRPEAVQSLEKSRLLLKELATQ